MTKTNPRSLVVLARRLAYLHRLYVLETAQTIYLRTITAICRTPKTSTSYREILLVWGKDVKKWIGTCDACQRKSKNHKQGVLRSLDILQHRFTDVAMDWCDAPFTEDGFNQILVVIDRLRKHITLIPAKATHSAKDTARAFNDRVVRVQGIPKNIVVDRDPQWTSKFWTALSNHLDIKMRFTTARHQNANGLAKSTVKTVKKMLTTVLNSRSGDRFLPEPINFRFVI